MPAAIAYSVANDASDGREDQKERADSQSYDDNIANKQSDNKGFVIRQERQPLDKEKSMT